MIDLKQFVEERDEMLAKCDYTLIDDFILAHKHIYGSKFITKWRKANENVKKLSYVKCIEGISNKTKEMIDYAEKLRKEVKGK